MRCVAVYFLRFPVSCSIRTKCKSHARTRRAAQPLPLANANARADSAARHCAALRTRPMRMSYACAFGKDAKGRGEPAVSLVAAAFPFLAALRRAELKEI